MTLGGRFGLNGGGGGQGVAGALNEMSQGLINECIEAKEDALNLENALFFSSWGIAYAEMSGWE
jgi:hypothetical protein